MAGEGHTDVVPPFDVRQAEPDGDPVRSLQARIMLLPSSTFTFQQKGRLVDLLENDPIRKQLASDMPNAEALEGFLESFLRRVEEASSRREEEFRAHTSKFRSLSRSGPEGVEVLIPAEDADEKALLVRTLAVEAPKTCNPPLSAILPAENRALVSTRWFAFREVEARKIDLSKLAKALKDDKLAAEARGNEGKGHEEARGPKKADETKYYPPLLAFFQGASRGQPGVTFALEDKSKANSSREDIRCLVTDGPVQRAASPSENKLEWHPSTTKDEAGIIANSGALGKVLKSILVHLSPDELEQLGTISSKCELLWMARFSFLKLDNNQRRLAELALSPQPPRTKYIQPPPRDDLSEDEQLWLIPDVDKRVLALESKPKAEQTLYELLRYDLDPPSGFRALTRFTAAIAVHHLLEVPPLELLPGTFCDGSDEIILSSQHPPILLDGLVPINAARSVVLLPTDASPPLCNKVVKISTRATIDQEIIIHALADKSECRFLRKADLRLSGSIRGAGEGLAAIVLEENLLKPIGRHHCDQPARARTLFGQVLEAVRALFSAGILHGDIKPQNILLTRGAPSTREARLNDYDLSLEAGTGKKGPFGTQSYMSPDVEEGGLYQEKDDLISLGLTFAYLCRIDSHEPLTRAGKIRRLKLLCQSHQVYNDALAGALLELESPAVPALPAAAR